MWKIALVLIGFSLCGCDSSSKPKNTVPDKDNTAVNERDQNDAKKTPLDQNENQTDIDITANIRKRVVASDMSVNAKNVKIITQDKKVTLRGPVGTEQEKQSIEKMAQEVAGQGNVTSELQVQP